jgi:hypothetical protein
MLSFSLRSLKETQTFHMRGGSYKNRTFQANVNQSKSYCSSTIPSIKASLPRRNEPFKIETGKRETIVKELSHDQIQQLKKLKNEVTQE